MGLDAKAASRKPPTSRRASARFVEEAWAEEQALGREGGAVGAEGVEGVGLVEEAGDGDVHGGWLPSGVGLEGEVGDGDHHEKAEQQIQGDAAGLAGRGAAFVEAPAQSPGRIVCA